MLLKFAFEDFIDDKKFNNLSEATIVSYRHMVKPFIAYCNEQGIVNVEEVTKQHFKDYLIQYQADGNKKANTINTVILRVKSFFNYLIDEGIVTENIAKKIKFQKVDVKIDTFTDQQINQMLAFYRTQKKRSQSYSSYRNYVLILFLLGTGARRQEAIKLKWDDVDFDNQSIQVYGKSRKYETIFLTDKLCKELMVFKAFSDKAFKEKNEYVFVNTRGSKFSINTIDYVFRELKDKMNFKDIRLSPHTFRHTYCSRLVMSNMNAFAIQKLMRHENIGTTQRYVNLWGSTLKAENDKHNPLNNFDF